MRCGPFFEFHNKNYRCTCHLETWTDTNPCPYSPESCSVNVWRLNKKYNGVSEGVSLEITGASEVSVLMSFGEGSDLDRNNKITITPSTTTSKVFPNMATGSFSSDPGFQVWTSTTANNRKNGLRRVVDDWIAGGATKEAVVIKYGPIEDWFTKNVTSLEGLFKSKDTFNADLSKVSG